MASALAILHGQVWSILHGILGSWALLTFCSTRRTLRSEAGEPGLATNVCSIAASLIPLETKASPTPGSWAVSLLRGGWLSARSKSASGCRKARVGGGEGCR